ncbi:hypothetical protein [Porphyromonas loveana]|uniref:hypothetical protein n=1 Tax=Porphyromonas loveana TaxID=1884669 RepID=UPI0035A128B1
MIPSIITLLIIFFPPIFIGYKAFRKKSNQENDEFFTAKGNIKEKQFCDTSLAYAYQVAAISLFTVYGATYGFWTILIPIFWGLGYYLLRSTAKRGAIKTFIMQNGSETLHGLLEEHYNKVKWIALLAGLTSVLGLAGTALFEAEYTASALTRVLTLSQDASRPAITLLLFTSFVAAVLTYILAGGQKVIVKTDHWQLKGAYLGFMLFLGGIIGVLISVGYQWTPWMILGVSVFLQLGLIWLLHVGSLTPDTKSEYEKILWLGLCIFLLGIILGYLSNFDANTNIPHSESWSDFAQIHQIYKPWVLGFSLISLFVSNVFWQLVDISNWQRISSMREVKNFEQSLSSSLKFLGLFSPISWIFAIFLGMCIRLIISTTTSEMPLIDLLSSMANSENFIQMVLSFAMLISLVFIMFSTLDSLIIAISFTAHKDIMPIFGLRENNSPKIGTLLITTILFIIYILARNYISRVDDILYSFYAFQLGLVPSILYALFGKKNKAHHQAAIWSILFGILTPIFILLFLQISPIIWSPVSTTIVSSSVFLIVNRCIKKKYN